MKIQYSLFDTLLEPVFVLNSEQKVVYCNETAATVVGLSIRKITRGMKLLDLFEFSEPIEGLTQLTQVTDSTPYKEVTFKTPQGGEGKIQITLQPIFDAVGDKNWIVFVRDVTLEERLQKKYRAELEQKEGVISALEEAKIQLENYSKNLEKMVAERTRELSQLNQTMTALLDSLGQGFFIFNSEGLILDVSSKACESTIECKPDGKKIWDVLKLSDKKISGFQKWMQTLFMEMLPFEDLAPLGPVRLDHSANRHISLEYHPLRTSEGAIEGVVVVASDITSLVEAQQQAEYEKEHAKLIIHLIKSKREVLRFISEAQDLLCEINQQVSQPEGPTDSETLYRYLHTLKGGAALFSIKEVAEDCHAAENILNEYKDSPSAIMAQSLREKCSELSSHFTSFTTKTQDIWGPQRASPERHIEIALSDFQILAQQVAALSGGASLSQNLLNQYILEPLATYLDPYETVIQSVAQLTGKNVAPLQIHSDEIRIAPEVYGPFLSTLVHAFRNAVDHGIETPEVRLAQGKSPEGHISVHAKLDKASAPPTLTLEIKDDGGGIDPQKVRAKLTKLGIDCSLESEFQIQQHIFDNEFSTREQVTEISGRGVGMSAIKVAAKELNGKVWVESKLGHGTSIYIEIPYLTTATVARETEKKAA